MAALSPVSRCTCPPILGPNDPCDACIAFESWEGTLTGADLARHALAFSERLDDDFRAFLRSRFEQQASAGPMGYRSAA